MPPVVLFDKSFLEGLSEDESVWFDHHFVPNICPVFWVETLSDLHGNKPGVDPETRIRRIANCFPEMRGYPNCHHLELCINELAGHKIALDGSIALPRKAPIRVGQKTGVKFNELPEVKALLRWQRKEFTALERDFAKGWRADLSRRRRGPFPAHGLRQARGDARRAPRDVAGVRADIPPVARLRRPAAPAHGRLLAVPAPHLPQPVLLHRLHPRRDVRASALGPDAGRHAGHDEGLPRALCPGRGSAVPGTGARRGDHFAVPAGVLEGCGGESEAGAGGVGGTRGTGIRPGGVLLFRRPKPDHRRE